MVNGTCDDVARCQVATLIKALHERSTVRQQQAPALTTHRLGDQKGFCLGMVQAGRMELVEFHVGDTAAGAPGHGDAVTTGGVRITGIQVNLAGAAGGEYHLAGTEGLDALPVAVQHIGTDTAVVCQPQFVAGDQVNGDVVFQQGDVAARARGIQQRGLHGAPGSIGRMQYPAGGMSPFPGEVKVVVAAGGSLAGKGHTQFHQPAYRRRRIFDGKTHRVRVI